MSAGARVTELPPSSVSQGTEGIGEKRLGRELFSLLVHPMATHAGDHEQVT